MMRTWTWTGTGTGTYTSDHQPGVGGVKVVVGEAEGGGTIFERERVVVQEVLVFLKRGDINSLQ